MKQTAYIFILFFIGYNLPVDAQCHTDRHTTNGFDGWVSCEESQNPNPAHGMSHWIEYDFKANYPLHDLVIWNMNHPEYLDDGFRTVIIETSTNGTNWSLFDTITFPRAPASGFYEGFVGPDLEGVNARYLLLTALDNHGGNCYGLSEIKIFTSDQEQTEFNLAFTPCEGDGVLRNITGGMEQNGVYSGKGVTDNSDETFDFDAGLAGPGVHTISYNYIGGSLQATIKVLPCTDQLCANCPDCGDFDQLMVNSNPIPMDIYHDDILNSSGRVVPSQPVNLRGSKEVILSPGFEVTSAGDFLAEIRECDENMIPNGGFEYEDQDWEFFVSPWNPVVATIDYDVEAHMGEKAARINITQSDGGAWQVSLGQEGHSIVNGQEYEVSFYCKKDSGDDFILMMQEDGDPWHTFMWQRITPTNMWTKYTFNITASKTVNNNVLFQFRMGEGTGVFYIDRIQLLEKN